MSWRPSARACDSDLITTDDAPTLRGYWDNERVRGNALYADAHTLTARCATIFGVHGTESFGCANLLALQYARAKRFIGRLTETVCLAIPVRVTALLEHGWAEADIGSVMTRVCTALVDAVSVGDYLIVHAGFAITRLDVAEAEQTLALFAEITAHYQGAGVALYPRFS